MDELELLLLGLWDYDRPGAPEPLLLPRLVMVPGIDAEEALEAAREPPAGAWPAIHEAVAAAVGVERPIADRPAAADEVLAAIDAAYRWPAGEGDAVAVVARLVEVLRPSDAWLLAAFASRSGHALPDDARRAIAGAAGGLGAPWAEHIAAVVAMGSAGDVVAEVTRAFPYDGRLVELLAGPNAAGPADRAIASLLPRAAMVTRGGGVMGERPADDDVEEASGAGPDQDRGRPPELHLDAEVYELPESDGPVRLTDAFRRGGRHRVEVALTSLARTAGAVADVAVPLDRTTEHELAISFYAPPFLAPTAPQILQITPGTTRSEAVAAEFTLPADLAEVAIDVIVEEILGDAGKVIQTATLYGAAVAPGEAAAGFRFVVDPRFAAAPKDQGPAVSLLLAGEGLAAYAQGPAALITPPAQILEYRADLGTEILDLYLQVERTADDLAAGFSDVVAGGELNELVAAGMRLRKLLADELAGHPEVAALVLDSDVPIQVVARDLETDYPIEFVYDGRPPNRAAPRLCPEYREALAAGACGDCRERDDDICPFDFWGLRRRVERHLVPRTERLEPAPVAGAGAGAPLPAALGPAVFAASSRVEAGTRELVTDALARAAGGAPPLVAADWTKWQEALAAGPARLLVLCSHSEQGLTATLEIDGDTIQLEFLGDGDVNPTGTDPGPIVLLAGCETAQPKYYFLSFVPRFIELGAAVVLATLALIREDVASRATSAVLDALRQVVASGLPAEERTVGEVLRRTRCLLLEKGDLTGFNLVAYGDADWRFEAAS